MRAFKDLFEFNTAFMACYADLSAYNDSGQARLENLPKITSKSHARNQS